MVLGEETEMRTETPDARGSDKKRPLQGKRLWWAVVFWARTHISVPISQAEFQGLCCALWVPLQTQQPDFCFHLWNYDQAGRS